MIASGFVGRERELGLLRGLLESARAGTGGVGLLVGEPGIGKTRTASVLYPSVLAALRQGLSFRAGLTAVNDASPPERRAEVASSFFVIAYVAITGTTDRRWVGGQRQRGADRGARPARPPQRA